MFQDRADLIHLLESEEQLKVSEVIHQAFIDVTEEGTEVGGATGTY